MPVAAHHGPRTLRQQARTALAWLFALSLLMLVVGFIAVQGTTRPIVVILSGSMEPTIHTGDAILMKSLRGRSPRVGEVVLLHVPAQAQQRFHYPERVVHRVVANTDGQLTTRGDAFTAPDPFTTPARTVHDRFVTVVPLLGQGLAFLSSRLGLTWITVGVALVGLAYSRRTRRTSAEPARVSPIVRSLDESPESTVATGPLSTESRLLLDRVNHHEGRLTTLTRRLDTLEGHTVAPVSRTARRLANAKR